MKIKMFSWEHQVVYIYTYTGCAKENYRMHFRCIRGGCALIKFPSTLNARRGCVQESRIYIRPYYSCSPRASPGCRVPFLKRTLQALTYSNPDPKNHRAMLILVDSTRGTPNTTLRVASVTASCIALFETCASLTLSYSSTMRKARLALREWHSH